MKAFLFRFVALAETDQVGCDDTVARSQKYRNHLAVKIAPGRVAVQAEEGLTRWRHVAGLFVQVMHAKPAKRRQIAEVAWRPGVAGQIIEGCIGCAQGIVAQRVVLHRLVLLVGPPLTEKILQHRAAFAGQHAAIEGSLVIQRHLGKQIDNRARCPSFRISRAENHAFEPRVQHCPAAHRARLQRDVKLAVVKPIVAQRLGCGTQRDDFGMGGWVVRIDGRVAARSNHLAVAHHHGADRNLAAGGSNTCLRECELHEMGVNSRIHNCYIFNSCLRTYYGGYRPI